MAIYFRASNDVFLTHDNLRNIAQATAPTAIVAVGIVLLLVSGEIDLSVGVVAALAPFLVHYAVDLYGVPVIPAILLAFAISAFIGFCNGFIVTKLQGAVAGGHAGLVLPPARRAAHHVARVPGADPGGRPRAGSNPSSARATGRR